MTPADGESDGGSGTIGPPDRQTLRLLERRCADDPLVLATEFEPDSYEPRLLGVDIDTDRYPSSVASARLDVRWFEGGDFSLHYVEDGDNDRWECRWDRHPNPHADRTHVHHPPDGDRVESLSLESTHPIDVCSTVLAAIEDRIERLWDRRE